VVLCGSLLINLLTAEDAEFFAEVRSELNFDHLATFRYPKAFDPGEDPEIIAGS